MVRVVFDTVVFVRSLINPRGVWGRLVFDQPGYRLIVSQPILMEILEVLRRPEIVRKYRSVAMRDPNAVLAILARAEVVEVMAIPAVSRDLKDDTFLATASAAGADYLVTEDEDLLVLREHEGTQILKAAAFLGILERAGDPTE